MKGASAPGVATQGTDHLLRPRKPREAGMHTAAFAFWGRWGRGSGQWAVKLDAATTWLSLVKIADAGFRERALEVLRRGATVSRPFGPSKFDSKRQVLSRMVGVGIAGRPTSLGRGPPLLILKVSVTVAVPCKPASPRGPPRPLDLERRPNCISDKRPKIPSRSVMKITKKSDGGGAEKIGTRLARR